MGVNWVEIVWIMMAAASFTLGFVHLLVWFKQRSRYASLAFFVLATSVAAFSLSLIHISEPTRPY